MSYAVFALALNYDNHNHEEQFFGVFDTIELAQNAISAITPLLKFEAIAQRENVYRAFGLSNDEYEILEWYAYPYKTNTFFVNVEDWRK